MPIFYPDIQDQKTAARTFTYGDKDVMLYALGVGMSHDPMDERELAFTYEKNLKVIPTAATVRALMSVFHPGHALRRTLYPRWPKLARII